MEKLELELTAFRKVFNERIQYFRQLQELSDTVVGKSNFTLFSG